MGKPLTIDIVTIFPGMLKPILDESILKRAVEKGLVTYNLVNLRDFAKDARRSVDDKPYGGGPGMLMMAEPLFDAVESLKDDSSDVILMTPQGRQFNQAVAEELSCKSHLIFVCGNYEGFDERVRQGGLVTDEISIGDYVLTNGGLPAAVVIDALVRLIPGVLGDESSLDRESFRDGILEYPQYTRPADFRGMMVPDILLSGNHEEIAKWRRDQAETRTKQRRPDLMDDFESVISGT